MQRYKLFSFALLMEDNGIGFGELFRREYSSKFSFAKASEKSRRSLGEGGRIPSFPLVMRSRIGTFFICLLFFIFCFLELTYATTSQPWQELKGDHFIIYYTQDEQFAKDVLRKAEIYYKDIASELGYQRHSNFWTWEKRVKIFIFPNKDSFLADTGQHSWSEGVADYTNKQIASYAWSQGFLEALLPHEIAHLIFRDYVGFQGEIPLWLDEGVAQWMEPAKREAVAQAVRALLTQKKLLSLNKITSLDVREVKEKDLVDVFYIEAISLVGFLIRKHGSEEFIEFCRQLRDGKNIDTALTFAYPTSMRSIEELEKGWIEHIKGG